MTRRWLVLVLVLSLGGAACSERAAEPVCTFGGATYQNGQTFPAGDGCNTCSCDPDGQRGVVCTAKRCDGQPLPQGSCSYGGRVYKLGEQFPAKDGCNSCVCGADGTSGIGCTMRRCIDSGLETCPTVREQAAAGHELNGKACSTNKLRCTYLIEDCADYDDVEWACTCTGVWDCRRGYDCPHGQRPDSGTTP